MKKVDLCKKVFNIKGEVIKDSEGEIKLNELAANLFAGAKSDKYSIRNMEVAKKIFFAEGPVEIEDADFERLKSTIVQSSVSNLIMSQLLEGLKES